MQQDQQDPESGTDTLDQQLRSFTSGTRRTGIPVLLFGILSVSIGFFCAFNQRQLLFGVFTPALISGCLLILTAMRILLIGQKAWKGIKSTPIEKEWVNDNSKNISKELSYLQQIKVISSILFATGIIVLVFACAFDWNDFMIGISLTTVIQFSILTIIALMTKFWLEIFQHELERTPA